MSIKTALICGMVGVAIMPAIFVGALGVASLSANVNREAQQRVNQDLTAVRTYYESRLAIFAERISNSVRESARLESNLAVEVQRLKQALDLLVLNVCDARGNPIAGAYPDRETAVPLQSDPVLRKALGGQSSWGTVVLDADRLQLEGGPALQNASAVESRGENVPGTTSALFWWVANPIRDDAGRVVAVIYGGRSLNLNFELVDSLRELVFGTDSYAGKPLGTVTIFLGGVRVATNVLGPDRQRAVGTHVSQQVEAAVLQEGTTWQDRAWVVDAWYFSAYESLADPDGDPIGMLYVGLLEAPYRSLRNRLNARMLGLTILTGVVAIAVALVIVKRVTSPIRQLSGAAAAMAEEETGDSREERIGHSYAEINHLAHVFGDMKQAISRRDRSLRDQNSKLGETNAKLERANRNYMETLGFVTHELKAPLAAMQSMIDVVVEGYTGDVPEKTASYLRRIRHNNEELQDMVKNYLDLSRAERGELVAVKTTVEFGSAVVEPSIMATQPLFDSRTIELAVICPPGIEVEVDPELMRIAVTNFLTNAAKYGRRNQSARLEVRAEPAQVTLCVWNEGDGFEPHEADALFKKFSRLNNENTRGKRGSGLGLFLCRQIAELHGGRVWAESEPGQWAQFSLCFPTAGSETDAALESAQDLV